LVWKMIYWSLSLIEQVAEFKKATTTNFNIKHTLCKKKIPFSNQFLYVAQTGISSIIMDLFQQMTMIPKF
jgi:hypothetical protein